VLLVQPTPVSPNSIRFGLFEADLSAGELRKRGRKIPLQDQPFRVLILLLQRAGELVSREEFQQALWPGDTFVEFDEGLNKAIQKVRQALDDSSDNPRFIETLPRKGYRFIAPVDGSVASPLPVSPVTKPAMGARVRVLFGVVLVALVVVAGVYFRGLRPAARSVQRTIPLTSYPGNQITPAFSPDGKQVAFAWDGEMGDNFDIYVKLVNAGAALRLTTNPAPDAFPAWSPDGRYIAFCRNSSDLTGYGGYAPDFLDLGHSEIRMVPALGGAERKLGESLGCRGLSWSPDGKYLALFDGATPQGPFGIFSLSTETGDKHRLTRSPNEQDYIPSFAPDGKTLAFVRGTAQDSGEIYVLPLTAQGAARGEPRRLTFDERNITGLDWTADSQRIVYSSNLQGGWSLWTIPAAGGTPERLKVTGENAKAVAVSHSGNKLVYARNLVTSSIWRLPGANSPDRKSAPVRFIASTRGDQEPQISPNGQRIVFSSSRSGNQELWSCDREGGDPLQLTSFGGPDPGSPRWSRWQVGCLRLA
jgi:Tol biopolymer transport system component/DNA-binding winged helix-turn-helix (wHTH) protein